MSVNQVHYLTIPEKMWKSVYKSRQVFICHSSHTLVYIIKLYQEEVSVKYKLILTVDSLRL